MMLCLYILITFLVAQSHHGREQLFKLGIASPSWEKHILTIPYTSGTGFTIPTLLSFVGIAIVILNVHKIIQPRKEKNTES